MGMKIKGDQELLDKLAALQRLRPGAQRLALYAGAKVMADALTEAVGRLPIDNGSRHPLHVISTQDRDDIARGVGIATFQDNGDVVDTLIGFNGYISRTEEKYPNGVPIPLIVRSIESGSSVRAEYPFVKKAMRAAKKQALEAMQAAADQELSKAK